MKFRNAAFAEATKSAYRSQLKHYIKFCNRHNYNLVPISPQSLLRYVVYLAQTLSANSIRQYLNVVRLIHFEMGFSHPLTQDEWVQHSLKSVVCGIKHIKGAPVNRKLPITVQILKQMYSLLNRYSSLDMTFWAACLVAFFGMLRKRSLFPAPGRPLYLTLDQCIVKSWGIVLHLVYSETIQYQQRQAYVALPWNNDPSLCAGRALFYCLKLAGSRLSTDYLFAYSVSGKKAVLTYSQFTTMLKRYLKQLGLSSREYSGHSFRWGGATHALNSGVPVEIKKAQGIWKSYYT